VTVLLFYLQPLPSSALRTLPEKTVPAIMVSFETDEHTVSS
jgi:hypothetical protein